MKKCVTRSSQTFRIVDDNQQITYKYIIIITKYDFLQSNFAFL